MAIDIAKPSAGAYGVFSQPYAASVARGTGNPGADIINQLALSFLARGERGGYADALAGANQAALQGANLEAGAEISKAYLNNIAPIANAGMAGAVQVAQPYVKMDQGRADVNDVLEQNATQQAAFKDTAAGIKDVASVGYLPSAADVGAMITPPIQETPMEVQPYLTPDAISDQLRAQAAMVAANRPPSSGGGGSDGVSMTITDDGFGDPQYSYRGKDPAAVEAAYRAQQGGGAASPAAVTNSAEARLNQYKAIGATWTRKANGVVEIKTRKGKVIHLQVAPNGSVAKETIVK